MEDKTETLRFGVQQYYTNEMAQYFNPLQVVASVLAKIEINPYAIKRLDINFSQQEFDYQGNVVRLAIEMAYPMPKSWIEHMKHHMERLLKDGFMIAYGKKTEKWFSPFEKDAPPFFTKEFEDEANKD
jgi:hypothetical protein